MCRGYHVANSFGPKSVWEPASLLLEPSLCEGPDRLVAGSRPGEDGPAYTCWAWAALLASWTREMDELILGRGIQQIILFLILGPGWTSPRPDFLGGEYKVKVWNQFLFKIRETVTVKGEKIKLRKLFELKEEEEIHSRCWYGWKGKGMQGISDLDTHRGWWVLISERRKRGLDPLMHAGWVEWRKVKYCVLWIMRNQGMCLESGIYKGPCAQCLDNLSFNWSFYQTGNLAATIESHCCKPQF